jgi:hypothetical protein
MSKCEIPVGDVLDLLLKDLNAERKVDAAKAVFETLPDLECVWTGQRIVRRFDVDHGIPFSLWRNNDLWNLFPAHPKANAAKSDKLPTRELLMGRRDPIVGCWRALKDRYPRRFHEEMQALAGREFGPIDWEHTCFSRFAEAVEMTAVQRRVERWSPG